MGLRAAARVLRALAAAALAAAASACAPTVTGLGQPVGAPALEADAFVAADGTRLPLRDWRPEGEARAVVLALHGFGDYANAFRIPGEAWARMGIRTYAYDQRGFGRSPTRGRWAGGEAMASDLAAALSLLRARHPGIPIAVLGESMGGAVAMAAAARGLLGDADGIVLVAPAVRGSEALGPVATTTLWFFAHVVPWLAGPSGGPAYQPTDNPEILREWAQDPLILRGPRVDMAWGLVQLMDEAVAATPVLEARLLVLTGARDALVPDRAMEAALARMKRAAGGGPRVARYAEGWHMLLRDLGAARAQQDVAHWVAGLRDGGAGPLPSGAERAARQD
jgi:alpha-beta hydrolase superfamily lysophospholipase